MATTGKTPGSAGAGIKKIFATSLTEVMSYDAEGVGTIRIEGNEIYKWAHFRHGDGNIDVAAGDVVNYLSYDDSTVTGDASDTDNIGAGVIVATEIAEDNVYCWIQIKGSVILADDVASASVGNVVTTNGAGDGTVVVLDAMAEQACGVLTDVTAGSQVLLCDFPF